MKLQILGTGCANCKRLTENTKAAVELLGVDAEIEKVEDIREIVKFRVLSTPALVVDGKVVLAGRIPSAQEIAPLLKA
ncbi:MAG TPA: thioredoxin family protein [Armatimonadota bacterium]|jgi:small redox-active disulfide protein 2